MYIYSPIINDPSNAPVNSAEMWPRGLRTARPSATLADLSFAKSITADLFKSSDTAAGVCRPSATP